MENIADDDSHGYAQDHRNGDPDYDCSSLVGSALNSAGFNVSKSSTTRNLYEQLKKCGFAELNINESRKRGDIFLTPGKHVVMCVDENNIVHASINENGKITNGKSGDQTGKEICKRSFYTPSYGWKYHLRYSQPVNTTVKSNLVVDISHHNIITNFDMMSNEISGVIIRVGYRGYSNGRITSDNFFQKHITELTKRNVNIGLYFFSQAINESEAIEEARFIINVAKSYKLYYPIFIDDEDYTEENIKKGMKLLITEGKLLCEPSAAIGIGAVLQGLFPVKPEDKVCFFISGGSVSLEQLRILEDIEL